MKRFIIKTSLTVFISVMLINIVMISCKDELSLYSHEKNAILAYNRLHTLEDTNKIVIIAGSNGGFSVNSRMINKAFQMPVVNTSTHAGIGVRMQFELYKDFLRKGDIVIFCPEYGGGKQRLYGESTLFRILSTHLPFAYTKISIPQWLFIYKYIGINYTKTLKHLGSKEFEGPYSAYAVNEYGDIEYERAHQDTITTMKIEGKMDEEVVNYYKYIHTYTKNKGITLVFLPPTLMLRDFKYNSKQIDSIAQCLKQNGIAYQALPSRYSFADSLYFDTPYHMTQLGANKRTEVLINDLQELLRVN